LIPVIVIVRAFPVVPPIGVVLPGAIDGGVGLVLPGGPVEPELALLVVEFQPPRVGLAFIEQRIAVEPLDVGDDRLLFISQLRRGVRGALALHVGLASKDEQEVLRFFLLSRGSSGKHQKGEKRQHPAARARQLGNLSGWHSLLRKGLGASAA